MSKNQIQGNYLKIGKLKKLMLEVLKNQKELSKVLLDKNIGLLSPSLVQITDPRMILEERKIIEDIENSNVGVSSDFPEILKELESRCDMKNKMITNLLRNLKNVDTIDSKKIPKNKKNSLVRACPDCKEKIKPRKMCKKCGEIDQLKSQHFLKCSDCGNEVVQKKICGKCRKDENYLCGKSSLISDYQSAESLATVNVPEFSTDNKEILVEFIREPSESFQSADEVSSTSLLKEEKISESFLSIKIREDKNFEEDEESIEALEMSFVKLSNELQEILPNVYGRVEDSGDHPSVNYYTPVSPTLTPPSTPHSAPQLNLVNEENDAFDVEVYDADDDTDEENDSDSAKNNNFKDDEAKAKEEIKTVTEYESISQKITIEADSEDFYDLPLAETKKGCKTESEEEFEDFDEKDMYLPALQMVLIPSSMSFQTMMRLVVAQDKPKNSFTLTPLHSIGKLLTSRTKESASFVNAFSYKIKSQACILMTVHQHFKVPFVVLSELPFKTMASLAVAKTEPTQKLPSYIFVQTTLETKIEIQDEPNRVEVKKIVSPTEKAIFETERNLMFTGVQLKETWRLFNLDVTEDDFQDASDFDVEKILKKLPDVPKGSEECIFASSTDFTPEGMPDLPKESEEGVYASTTDFTPETEEMYDKLLKLLSDLEQEIKESTWESKSLDLVREISESVEILQKTSGLSNVAKLLESDSRMEIKKEEREVSAGSEGLETEKRIEKSFDRIDRLIRENEEATKFVEAFWITTARRVAEYQEIKKMTQEFYQKQESVFQELEKSTQFSDKINPKDVDNEVQSTTFEVVNDAIQSTTVKDTIFVLINDLDKLKSKAKEKNERCKEIFGERFVLPKQAKPLTGLEKARSSFTMKSEWTSIVEFKNVGFNNFYLAWTKPEGSSEDSIIGYEILVNGKINQKIRNPERLQTVLYSIPREGKTEIKLFGLTKQGSMLLGELTYLK